MNFSKPAKLFCHESFQKTQRDLQFFDRVIHVCDSEAPQQRKAEDAPRYVQCTHAIDADGNDITYVPGYYDLTTDALRKRHEWVWFDYYVDGAEYLNEHCSQTCAVRISNQLRNALHKNDAHHVFAIIAPGVDAKPILEMLALDLRVLQEGWDVGNGRKVYGGLGMVLADVPQRCANCCHGGAASFMNCPHCLATIPDRLHWKSCDEFGNGRSDQMNRKIVEEIMASDLSRTGKADALRLMGICVTLGPGAVRGGKMCCCHAKSFYAARLMTGGILPGVNADVNVASAVDPDHLFCYGLFKHIIQQGVASIQTMELRTELTVMVQNLLFPSGTTTLFRQWNAVGASKFGKGTLSMRGYEQLFMALIMCAEHFFQKHLYVHMVNLWKFYTKYVAGVSLDDEMCAAAEVDCRALVAEGQQCANDCWNVPNGHALISLTSSLWHLRNASLGATGSFERVHAIKNSANFGSRSFEASVMTAVHQKAGMNHLLSGGTYGKLGKASRELIALANSGDALFNRLTLRSLRQPSPAGRNTQFKEFTLEYGGAYELSEASASACTWSAKDLRGLKLWAFDLGDGTEVRAEGFVVERISYTDPKNGKSSQLKAGDDVCVPWPFEEGNLQSEYLRVGKIAIAIADRGFETIACLLVCPMWWKQCGRKQDRMDHGLRGTALVELDLTSHKWVSVAGIADTVMVVHSCGQGCSAKSGTVVHEGSRYEVWDADNGLRLPTRNIDSK